MKRDVICFVDKTKIIDLAISKSEHIIEDLIKQNKDIKKEVGGIVSRFKG